MLTILKYYSFQIKLYIWTHLRFIFKANGIILIYHRVRNTDNDINQLSVSIDNFEDQLVKLKNKFEIVSIDNLFKVGKTKKTKLAITFDDGYADNYLNAFPLLLKYKMPATIFVTTDYINTRRIFWWDVIEAVVYNDRFRKEYKINDKESTWKKYGEIHRYLKSIPEKQRQIIINRFIKEYKLFINIKMEDLCLSSAQIREMASSGLITFGSHTCTHSQLGRLNYFLQKEELKNSKSKLEKITKNIIEILSYPFGTIDDFNINTFRAIKATKYRFGISNSQDCVRTIDRIFHLGLPRILVRDWKSDKLIITLSKLLK